MSGFVYIWRDKKHNRFYIGSHWGSEDDGYICSSKWMRNAHYRRPHDFKRRILERVETTRKELLNREAVWLNLISDKEFGSRYYNLRSNTTHWHGDPKLRLTISEKMSLIKKGVKLGPNKKKRAPMSDEHKAKLRGPRGSYKKKVLSDEHKANISRATRGISKPMSKEHKEAWYTGRWGNK